MQIVFDWPTCKRIGLNALFRSGVFETSSTHYTIIAKDATPGSEIKTATNILLQHGSLSPSALTLTFGGGGALKSGMRVQIRNENGPLGITPHAKAGPSAHSSWPRTASAVIDSVNSQTDMFFLVNATEAHVRNWVVYKKSAGAAGAVAAGTAPLSCAMAAPARSVLARLAASSNSVTGVFIGRALL